MGNTERKGTIQHYFGIENQHINVCGNQCCFMPGIRKLGLENGPHRSLEVTCAWGLCVCVAVVFSRLSEGYSQKMIKNPCLGPCLALKKFFV